MLGNSRLNYEELLTFVVHAEATLNGRPLTYVTEDPNDLIPLTPSMFLMDNERSGMTEVDHVDASFLTKKMKSMRKLKEELKMRFKKEYLSLLVQQAGKSQQQLKVGDVVFLTADGVKRQNWPLARVVEILPGQDGKVRTVRVKTADSEFLRPIQRLVPLEVDQEVATGMLSFKSESQGGSMSGDAMMSGRL